MRAMWRALIAGVVFQHASIQSLLRELGRNPALLEICGFDPLPFQSAPVTELREGSEGASAVTHPARVRSTVPSHWNFSRFLACVVRLEKKRGLVSAMIENLRASSDPPSSSSFNSWLNHQLADAAGQERPVTGLQRRRSTTPPEEQYKWTTVVPMWKAEKEEPDYDPKKPITRAVAAQRQP